MTLTGRFSHVLAALGIFVALDLIGRSNYLLFHSIVELFSIVIAVGIFVVAWETRLHSAGGFLLFLGTAYFFVAIIDLLHLLSYKGMGIFPGTTANIPTQLWLAARYLQGFSLLAAAFLVNRPVKIVSVLIIYAIFVAGILLAIHNGVFPEAFIDGKGLTPFKIASEYLISLVVAIAALCFWKRRGAFDRHILILLIWSMIATIASEMAFTLYVDVYGLLNEIGHMLKVLSFYLVYAAVIRKKLRQPYEALVIEIDKVREAEEELRRHREHLVELVEERTRELAGANERLKEIDRLKSLFIASMSHELRTPLNSVIGFSSILLNEWIGTLNDEQKKCLTSVLRSGKHLLSLINDVIDVSKIEAGVIETGCDDFDLAELLAELEQTFTGEAQERGLFLAVQTVQLTMCTDRRRLLQCLLNLVSNALKFTEQGRVTVAVRCDEEQREVTIAVTDSGIGIAVADQSRLFQAFSRIPSPLSAKVLGTGLGLYLTKKIVVEILRGTIGVTSEPGSGSTFTMTIPTRLEGEQENQQVPAARGVKA